MGRVPTSPPKSSAFHRLANPRVYQGGWVAEMMQLRGKYTMRRDRCVAGGRSVVPPRHRSASSLRRSEPIAQGNQGWQRDRRMGQIHQRITTHQVAWLSTMSKRSQHVTEPGRWRDSQGGGVCSCVNGNRERWGLTAVAMSSYSNPFPAMAALLRSLPDPSTAGCQLRPSSIAQSPNHSCVLAWPRSSRLSRQRTFLANLSCGCCWDHQ